MAMRGPRHPIGAAPWIAEERTTALRIAQSEVEEFMFSAKNEMDWLNEHMAEVFSEKQRNVADIFKTPGKLRGKTPRTARKGHKGDIRTPLTDVFSATPKGAPNPFAVSKLGALQQQRRRQSPPFKVAEDKPSSGRWSQSPPHAGPSEAGPAPKAAVSAQSTTAGQDATKAAPKATTTSAAPSLVDSGYHGSQSQDVVANVDDYDDEDELAAAPAAQLLSQPAKSAVPQPARRKPVPGKATKDVAAAGPAAAKTTAVLFDVLPDEMADRHSPTQPTTDSTFHSAKEEQTATVAGAAVPVSSANSALPTAPADLSSSPFQPVRLPSPIHTTNAPPPAPEPSTLSPARKSAVPQLSSPLQSTTPACPPPQELLSAMDLAATVSTSSSVSALACVPPAVPTPSTTAGSMSTNAQDVAALAVKSRGKREDSAKGEAQKQGDNKRQRKSEEAMDDEEMEEDVSRSPSDRSSPVRPIVRKSSINFASLPAREPFTSNKSMGGLSRTSHSGRTSYYNRLTGGKSLGNVRSAEVEQEADGDGHDDDDDVDMDGELHTQASSTDGGNDVAAHNKTYAQRLHDRISMLGKSQANGLRPSKSLANHLPNNTAQSALSAFTQQEQKDQSSQQHGQEQQRQQAVPVSKRSAHSIAAPGAFPEDEEDDSRNSVVPPAAAATDGVDLHLAKSHVSANVAQDVARSTSDHSNFVLPKSRQQIDPRPASPKRAQAPTIPERTTSTHGGHMKSASVPSLPLVDPSMQAVAKPISVSNPAQPIGAALASVSEADDRPLSPYKSPSRNFRDSPLKQVKNKLSSIIKSSRGLLASSAAISAEGKSLLLSPSSARLNLLVSPSTETLSDPKPSNDNNANSLRSESSRNASTSTSTSSTSAHSASSAVADTAPAPISPTKVGSPARAVRKTRASAERERRELKQRDKESKETQRMVEQIEKLEKMREKEREKARVFGEEQEKATIEQKQAQPTARKAEQHDVVEDVEMVAQQPVLKPQPQSSSPNRAPAKATRTSPRKAAITRQTQEEDVTIPDAPLSMLPPPPPSHGAAPSNSSVSRPAPGARTVRRPIKPTKEAPAKTKQVPTVIRVNTSSSQQQQQQQKPQPSHIPPSNSVLASTLHETLNGPQQPPQPHQLKNKASVASLHAKPSLQSLKSSVSSSGRPKALELAARRKEQEEREAQRKRDAKAEMERKRAALQEQEEQRRQELQKQKEREREQALAEAAAAKRAAATQQRQAAIEKAKQTRAPPPAPRTQLPNGPSAEYGRHEHGQPPRPQSRLATAASSSAAAAAPAQMHRSQEELHRPANALLSNANKSVSKRPLPGADSYEYGHGHSRPGTAGGATGAVGMGANANMPAYKYKDAKRIRLSEEFDEDELEMGGHIPRMSSIKGPPIRPSGGFKKEIPNKLMFGNGYAAAAGPSANVSRDLFKNTVTAQHNHHTKTGHPLDMAQLSKGAIPFATNSSATATAAAAAASSASAVPVSNPHKTPLRPVDVPLTGKSTAKSAVKSIAKTTGKSAAKSSPRFPNGDGIELPEIQTDDEDSEDDGHVNVAPWADSPDLRRALMRQETVDPFQVFGPPGPLNMEEVFNKSKDRWHKFRARTSSANWSGADRLTEEDIRKDLAARDKIRREGGWSYDFDRDMV
ncbi:inner centromere ark-binding region protein [Niveomyces insectorum RCEF 264]|uniref:Inner centromere ark-binding region protein n=1 Tax=Niveomyces insectorum RCEF 264 TaxID=1081102 RepID=A0A162LC10_9HYPO|nr:inner centromere ark-binding region protein [Niveomyces insectorum RCEF 264]